MIYATSRRGWLTVSDIKYITSLVIALPPTRCKVMIGIRLSFGLVRIGDI